MLRHTLTLIAATLGLALLACDDEPSASTCVPGMQIACPCRGGEQSIQRCSEDGKYGECMCGEDSPVAGASESSVSPEGGSGGAGGKANSAQTRGNDHDQAGQSGKAGSPAAGSGGKSAAAGSGGKGAAAGSGGSSGNGGAGGNGSTSVKITAGSGTTLVEGSGQLIAAFATKHGVVIVLSSTVRLLDRDGKELGRWDDSREITAAALEGDRLGVADGAIITGLNVADKLHELSSTQLVESCSAAVMVSGNRFVCGPQNDWDRVFYVYDIEHGTLLSSSNKYTYNGRPMRRVPGANKFITVSDDLSPSDFHLYNVGDDNAVSYLGESPYHGDFRITNTYAFDSEPPAHLVTDTGLLLDIGRADCMAGQGPSTNGMVAGCFVKDGVLGTLSGAQTFIAMSNHAGTLYALVDTGATATSAVDGRNVLLQSIDVAARKVVTQSTYKLTQNLLRVVALSLDEESSKVLLATSLTTSNPSNPSTMPQYEFRVELLSL